MIYPKWIMAMIILMCAALAQADETSPLLSGGVFAVLASNDNAALLRGNRDARQLQANPASAQSGRQPPGVQAAPARGGKGFGYGFERRQEHRQGPPQPGSGHS